MLLGSFWLRRCRPDPAKLSKDNFDEKNNRKLRLKIERE